MGTITHLLELRARARNGTGRCTVVVTAYGFATGERCVAWQTVSEIWGYRIDVTDAGEACLEFVAGDVRVVVGEQQPGFTALDAAVAAAFPSMAGWRAALLQPTVARNRTLLYRRTPAGTSGP